MQALHGDLFSDPAMRAAFSATAMLQAMLDFEALLAEAEAEAGIVPPAAALAIAAACQATRYDAAEIGRQTTLAGNPAIPLVKMLTAEVARHDRDAATWVHWGATSQDVIDSAQAALARAGSGLIVERLTRIMRGLARHAASAEAMLTARTFLQQATPIPLGLKAASWLAGLTGLRTALVAALPAPIQFGGASGSLSALGDRAETVARRLRDAAGEAGAELMPSHALRQRPVRTASELGIILGALGKIALDIALMAQNEVGEASEPAEPGKGGSSAMPHKQNPVLCTAILACAKRAPGLVATMQAAMLQEHERGLGGWHAEWETLAELFRLAGAASLAAARLVEGLTFHTGRMADNLEASRGLVFSEALALAAGARIGRLEAKALVEAACRRALAENRHLLDVALTDPAIAAALPAGLAARLGQTGSAGLTDGFAGASSAFVAETIAASEAETARLGPPRHDTKS
jgi:3-carboxy-cis,cis-muconate cycloisomerase